MDLEKDRKNSGLRDRLFEFILLLDAEICSDPKDFLDKILALIVGKHEEALHEYVSTLDKELQKDPRVVAYQKRAEENDNMDEKNFDIDVPDSLAEEGEELAVISERIETLQDLQKNYFSHEEALKKLGADLTYRERILTEIIAIDYPRPSLFSRVMDRLLFWKKS